MNDTSGIAGPILCDIIASEMGLSNQAVWISDENRMIPKDNGLYVTIGLADSHVLSAVTKMVELPIGTPPLPQEVEINSVHAREVLQIDIFSRSTAAKTRHWEIIAALQSIYGQQQQELYNFKISRNPMRFLNTSSAEGGSFINRYTLTFACFVWYSKQKTLTADGGDYYDKFCFELVDDLTINDTAPFTWDDPNGTWDGGGTWDSRRPIVEFCIEAGITGPSFWDVPNTTWDSGSVFDL